MSSSPRVTMVMKAHHRHGLRRRRLGGETSHLRQWPSSSDDDGSPWMAATSTTVRGSSFAAWFSLSAPPSVNLSLSLRLCFPTVTRHSGESSVVGAVSFSLLFLFFLFPSLSSFCVGVFVCVV
ncbi:uncharacterized protein DS421_3g65650 [Arachis hypogaea]|nr:uncharacterized protein DS421_3g65650 [Arachis hypogaea]